MGLLMKKALNLFIVFVVMTAIGGINARQAPCGGIPVIDAANLAEQLKQYLLEIKAWQELLEQSTTMTNQYMQMLRSYQQVLREYNHFLNQIRSIRHMIDDKDWMRLMRLIRTYYGKSKRSAVTKMDPESEGYESEIEELLRNYGHVPRDPSAVQSDAQTLGIWSDQYRQEAEQDYRNYNLYKDRLRMVSDNAKKDERFREDIEKHAMIVGDLGDESDLATMQEIAAENITIMNQLAAQMQIQNQMLMNMEMAEAKDAAIRAKAREAELQRLKNRKQTKLLGRDRWGDF